MSSYSVSTYKKTKNDQNTENNKKGPFTRTTTATAAPSSRVVLGGSVVSAAAAGKRRSSSSAAVAALPDGDDGDDGSSPIDLAAYTFIVDDTVFASPAPPSRCPSSESERRRGEHREGEGEEEEGGGGGGGGGEGSVAWGQVGGSGPQTLFGFALAAAVLRRLRVGGGGGGGGAGYSPLPSLALVAGIGGGDLPSAARLWLGEADAAFGVCRGVSWMPPPLATPRAWQLVEGDGTRTQVWRKASSSGEGGAEWEEARAAALLPPLSPPSPPSPSSPSSLSSICVPRSVIRNARAHHAGLDPLNPKHAAWLSALRAAAPPGTTRISAETFKECETFPSPRELRALLRPLDLFSPNEAEAASLVEGERGRSAALAARSLLLLTADEEGAGGGGGGGATGAGGAETTFLDSVIVRRGGLGAVLVSRGSRDRALSVPAVSGLRLRDTTGCGNAFLGAYAAAAAAAAAATAATAAGISSVDAALALGVASAAAAAVAEVLGTPALSADLFFPSNAQVERAADRALAVRNACEEVEV